MSALAQATDFLQNIGRLPLKSSTYNLSGPRLVVGGAVGVGLALAVTCDKECSVIPSNISQAGSKLFKSLVLDQVKQLVPKIPLLGSTALAKALLANPHLACYLKGALALWAASVINFIQFLLWSRGTAWGHAFWITPLQSATVFSDGAIVEVAGVSYKGEKGATPLVFKKDSDREYYKNRKIVFLDFIEKYRKGEIDLKDGLNMYDVIVDSASWSYFALNWNYLHFILTQYLPDVAFHTAAQDDKQVTEHYNRGNDFFNHFLGPSMCYTSGYFITGEESLETSQYHKITEVLRKVGLQPGEAHLDIGCGWGTLVVYAAKHFKSRSYGVTAAKEGAKWGEGVKQTHGITDAQATFHVMDYRKIPSMTPEGKFKRITCLEMAEHVGVKNFPSFLKLVHDSLTDDGRFYLQIAGLRENPRHGDLVWGVFMNRYVFPGADASMPLHWVIKQLELAGFEIHSEETIGVHYALTIERWNQNWISNKAKILSKEAPGYGQTWYRTWEIFLAWSSLTPKQGRATCYQIVCNKNLNNYDRKSYFGEGKHVYNWDAKSVEF